jgi:hypothetical protein
VAAFLALNGAALLAAIVVAVAAELASRTSALALGVLAGYLVVVHSVVLGSGLAGHLTLSGAGALIALAAVGAVVLWLRRPRRPDAPADARGLSPSALAGALIALGAGLWWSWPHLFSATRLWVWDDYTYHMVYPALWLQERAITAAMPAQAFTMQAWYPLSASVVSAWFMLPWHGVRADALAWVSLTGVLYGALVAAGAAELCARVGARPGVWAIAVLLFATSSRVTIMASSFSDADLATAAALFGAFAFAVPRADGEESRDVRVDAWYAALLSGIALGVKVSAAPQALVILVMTALRAARVRGAAAVGAIFAIGWVVTAGYWYARNVAHTGNPVYPAAFLVWPGTRFPETTLLEYARRYGVARTLSDALAVYLNWPVLHAALALAGLVGLAAWVVARRRSLSRPWRFFAWGTLALTGVIVALLPAAPYSAGNALTFRSGFVHWDSMRYVALLPILGWTALGVVASALAPRWPTPRLPWALRTDRQRVVVVGVVALVLAVVMVFAHRAKAADTAASIHREPYFGAAAAVLDRQPPGTRVAVFGDQWIFPAFGDRGHLRPVRLDRDGRPAVTPIGDGMEPGELGVSPAAFLANLRASRIDVVVLVRQPHPGRPYDLPSQHAALEAIGEARLLHRDRAAAIWRVER